MFSQAFKTFSWWNCISQYIGSLPNVFCRKDLGNLTYFTNLDSLNIVKAILLQHSQKPTDFTNFSAKMFLVGIRKWMVFWVRISWVNNRKYENIQLFRADLFASLQMWYYFRLCFSFCCSGNDLTVIKKSQTLNYYWFLQKYLFKNTNLRIHCSSVYN